MLTKAVVPSTTSCKAPLYKDLRSIYIAYADCCLPQLTEKQKCELDSLSLDIA